MAATAAVISSSHFRPSGINFRFPPVSLCTIPQASRTTLPICACKLGNSFSSGSPVRSNSAMQWTAPFHRISNRYKSVRCEQSSNGLDVWAGRGAMVGFAAAVTVEITTGKGLLENIGLPTPLPSVALAVTGLVGVLTAFFIFQSASDN